MKQREALNLLILDILQLNKKRNKILAVALMVSIAFNIILSCIVFDMKIAPVEYVNETIIMGAVMTKKP